MVEDTVGVEYGDVNQKVEKHEVWQRYRLPMGHSGYDRDHRSVKEATGSSTLDLVNRYKFRSGAVIAPENATESETQPMTGSDLPKIGAPATRALAGLGVTQLEQVTDYSEAELLALHGFGPRALRILGDALAVRGLSIRP